MNRRKYIHSLARIGLTGAMALVAGVLVSRKQVRLERSCGESATCSSCRKLQQCDRLEARKERGNGKG